jgi:hypothetical protein
MKPLRWKMLCAVMACGASWLNVREATAQSLGNSQPSLGTASTGAPSTAGSFMSTPVPLFGAAVPNIMSDPNATATGSSAQGGITSSPFYAPFVYSSMLQAAQPYGMFNATTSSSSLATSATSASTSTSTSTTGRYGMGIGMNPSQLGLLMLATQNTRGVGSGRLSGARPGPQSPTAASSAATAKRRSAARPGGLAARYFNRVGSHTPYPQKYYNRQSRYFP